MKENKTTIGELGKEFNIGICVLCIVLFVFDHWGDSRKADGERASIENVGENRWLGKVFKKPRDRHLYKLWFLLRLLIGFAIWVLLKKIVRFLLKIIVNFFKRLLMFIKKIRKMLYNKDCF